ncbi:uncharacterized protein LOC131230759 isoform X2 [Magnolia sinica]|nr:uncharacterized protein LOC131230759 isoform X2 [Magnolia sinica]
MDSVEVDHDEECMEETLAYRLLSTASPDISGIYGDPQVPPRVGNEYQVEIPQLTTESRCLQPMRHPTDPEQMFDVDNSIQIGLPIPVMWVHDIVDQMKHEQSEIFRNMIVADTTQPIDSEVVGNEMDVDLSLQQLKMPNLDNKCESKGYVPVPGSLGGSWSDIEQESFILGLYIFGKNLIQVQRFVGSKDMGDVQSFYYGKFYRSDGHRKWSECRKMRSRRCIHGQRIFTGWRQQELLSRLLPHMSEECRNTLQEVTKTLGEGKVSLEEYVSSLKAMVGLNILVEAVGVGKGKHDLTGVAMEPVKANPPISTRSELPVGKACSSLSSAEIIKFLTGDFRLSKARSNDLFWEAVWPRLLASGWHSEQPKNNGYATSKALVFLIPGIKKFSRRKLVKGNQYFDSVSDVLNKVAADPMLLEFEVEAVHGGITKEENGWDQNAEFHKMGPPSDHQRHCYLRPRVQDCDSKLTKFTVVDTSLVHGEKSSKVRELRSLPVDTARTSRPTNLSKERDDNDSSEDEPAPADKISNDQEDSFPATSDDKKAGMLIDGPEYVFSLSKQGTVVTGPHDNCEDQYPDLLNKQHPRKSIKRQFSRRVESVRPKYLSPILKRRRLNACNREESRRCTNALSTGPCLNEEERRWQSHSPEASNTVVTEEGPSQPKVSASSSGKGSADGSSGCILSENGFSTSTVSETASHDKPQKRALIDLNLPHSMPDFETDGPYIEAADSQEDMNTKGSSFPPESNQRHEDSLAPGTSNGTDSTNLPVANCRRQSTRNRPLTTKVLEALECGFFNARRRGRGTKAQPRGNLMPRPPRRRRGVRDGARVSNSGNAGTDITDSQVDGADECSSNMNVVSESQIRVGKKGTHEFLEVPRTAYVPGIFTGSQSRCG